MAVMAILGGARYIMPPRPRGHARAHKTVPMPNVAQTPRRRASRCTGHHASDVLHGHAAQGDAAPGDVEAERRLVRRLDEPQPLPPAARERERRLVLAVQQEVRAVQRVLCDPEVSVRSGSFRAKFPCSPAGSVRRRSAPPETAASVRVRASQQVRARAVSTRASMRACVCVRARECMCVRVPACVRASVRACVRVPATVRSRT